MCFRCLVSVETLHLFFLVAVIAMLVPFFNDVVGLLGALGFWPLTVFLPIQMHLKQAGMRSPLLPSDDHVFEFCHCCCLLLLLPIISDLYALHHPLQLLQQCIPLRGHSIKFLTLFAALVCRMLTEACD